MKPRVVGSLLAASAITFVAIAANSGYSQTPIKQVELNKVTAARHYLEIVCPSNAAILKGRKVMSRLLTAKQELENAIRQRSLDKSESSLQRLNDETKKGIVLLEDHKKLQRELASSYRKTSNELLNPVYIWPEDVRNDIKAGAAAYLERAAIINEKLDYEITVQPPNGIAMIFSSIRAKLGLNERGADCQSSQ
jgi:hypothetical protein